MRWLDFPKMAVSLVLAAIAALAMIGINEAGYQQSTTALSRIGEAQRERQTLNLLLQNIVDAETGQRGFLLTGETRYRAPYDSAIAQVDGLLNQLRQAYVDQPQADARLTQLAQHVGRKVAEMEMSVRLRQEGNEDAWKFVITTDVGREEMEAIRREAGLLIAGSNDTIREGQRDIARALQFGRLGIAAVALAGLLAFYLYLRQTHRLREAGERQQLALQRERNALEDEVRERTSALAELATHLQVVRENERGYLARELHDELGSLLTAAKLDVARLKSRLADSPDATERLVHLNELLNSGIALKRRIIEDLRPSSLSNLGLIPSLEILGREFGERTGVEVDMSLEPVSLNDADQLTVYRMVQEGLTNISKYAHAREANIVMKNDGDQVVIELTDDGDGFDDKDTRPSSHGLAGMRHRVEAAKGRLSVDSRPGGGTRLVARLPSTTESAASVAMR